MTSHFQTMFGFFFINRMHQNLYEKIGKRRKRIKQSYLFVCFEDQQGTETDIQLTVFGSYIIKEWNEIFINY